MTDAESPGTTAALLDDLARAEHDVLSLAEHHGLSLAGLVDWACRAETRRIIAGMCVLADAQTQLLLSRYRLVAATRLIAQATADADSLPPEQVRRACVDLLKTELSRAADLGGAQDDDEAEFKQLRELLSASEQSAADNETTDDETIEIPKP